MKLETNYFLFKIFLKHDYISTTFGETGEKKKKKERNSHIKLINSLQFTELNFPK